MRLVIGAIGTLSLLLGMSIGLIGTSKGAAADTQFSAAYAVVEQEGSVGRWAFLEPPGSWPVSCAHFEPFGSEVRQIYLELPVVYAVIAAGQQEVTMRVEFQRRLPDGSLKDYLSSDTYRGYPEYSKPYGGFSIKQNADNGSTIVASVDIDWYAGTTRTGHVRLRYSQYQTIIAETPDYKILPVTNACKPGLPATATLGVTQGTVNATVPIALKNFAGNSGGTVAFDGKAIGTISTDVIGRFEGAFVVPAAPMGNHTVKVTSPYGPQASATFTIKPRIKVIPNTVSRGQTVDVSLRGYAKYENVRIRWKKGISWVELARVTTSSTGSANVDVKVPTFAVDGPNSVRGDGTYGHAQTNAVTVVASASSSAKASPTPTKTATPKPTAPAIPAIATPLPTATPSPTVEVSSPEPTETPVAPASPEATETAIPTPVTSSPEPTTEPSAEATPGAAAPGEGADE